MVANKAEAKLTITNYPNEYYVYYITVTTKIAIELLQYGGITKRNNCKAIQHGLNVNKINNKY